MTTINGRSIPPGRLEGNIRVPSSKSITHRAAILAALSRRPTRIAHPLECEDTLYTLKALETLGYEFERRRDAWVFTGKYQRPSAPVHIFVGNSGTTARLITAFAALQPIESTIDGTPRMRRRPMSPLIRALKTLHISLDDTNGSLPLRIRGGRPKGNIVEVDATTSSQYLSALMLIAPFLPGGLTLVPTGKVVSRAYVRLTMELLHRVGIEVYENSQGYRIQEVSTLNMGTLDVEGDVSSASYFLIGAAISGGWVQILNVGTSSIQGDREIFSILAAAGAQVEADGNNVRVAANPLRAIDWDMEECPDLVPGVAIMALFSRGRSRLRKVQHLRFKESDRIEAIIQNVRRLGGRALVEGDDLLVHSGVRSGASIHSFNDHRIAMSFALAGLRLPGVVIEQPECVAKSYPGFWQDLIRLHRPVSEGEHLPKEKI